MARKKTSIKKKALSSEAIDELFAAIGNKHKTKFPEIVIAKHTGTSAFTPRNWTTRGIPVKYWTLIAKLSGLSVEDVKDAHEITG
jgi:hypothetical protein